MDEAKRFLRFIAPGVLMVAELLVLTWILAPAWTIAILGKLQAQSSVAAALGTVVALGGVGYVLTIMHHNLAAWERLERGLDYRDLALRLRSKITYRNIYDGAICDEATLRSMTREEAWCIVTALWHLRREAPAIKGIDPRAQFLGDFGHSVGAARLGMVFATGFAIVIGSMQKELSLDVASLTRIVVAVGFAVAMFFSYHFTYRRMFRLVEAFAEHALHDVLAAEAKGQEEKPVAHVLIKKSGAAEPISASRKVRMRFAWRRRLMRAS